MIDTSQYSLPSWRWTRWLTRMRRPVDHAIEVAQVRSLYGTMSIFLAATIATLTVAVALFWRHQTWAFAAWVAADVLTIGVRIAVLLHDHRAAQHGRPTHTDLYLALTLAWYATAGYGAAITIASGDYAGAIVAGISTASIAGGMCVRYFGAPRFVLVGVSIAVAPLAIACLMAADPILKVTGALTVLFVFSISQGAIRLNRLMIAVMEAQIDQAERAVRDPLTGQLNRAGLTEAAEAARRQVVAGAEMTLFYLDLDGFKPVNDRHGHAAGDAVLIEVGRRLGALVYSDGHVARLGGDEFVVIAPTAGARDAQRLADTIVMRLAEQGYAIEAGIAHVGVSVGAAMMDDDDTLDDVLRRADRALYGAKTGGGRQARLAA